MRPLAPLFAGLAFAAVIATVVAATRAPEACPAGQPVFLAWLAEERLEPSSVLCYVHVTEGDDLVRTLDRGVAGIVLDESTASRLPEEARRLDGVIYVGLGMWADELRAALAGLDAPSPSSRDAALASDDPSMREHARHEHHAMGYRVVTAGGVAGGWATIEPHAPLDRILAQRAAEVQRLLDGPAR